MEEEFKNESDLTSQEVTPSQDTGREVATDQALERHFIEPSDNEEEAVPSLFLDDLTGIKVEPTEWLVEGFLPLGQSLTGVVGESSCGKSTLVYDMVLDYITGKDKYFERDMYGDPRERKAVILCSEGQQRILIRILGYLQENNLTLWDIKGKLFLLDKSKLIKEVKDCNLCNVNTVIALEKSLRTYKTKFSMIIIDTLNGFYRGKENSADEMGTFMENVENHLALPFDSNVIIIHHTGLASQNGNNVEEMRARGSTAFKAKLDSVITCKGKIVEGLEIYNDKQRDGEYGSKLFIKSKQIPVKAVPLNSKGKATTTVIVDKSVDSSQVKKEMGTESGKKTMKSKAIASKNWLEGLMSRRELPYTIKQSIRPGTVYQFYSKDLIPFFEKELELKPSRICQELNPKEDSKTIGSLVQAELLGFEKLGPKNYVYWTFDCSEYINNSGVWFVSSDLVFEAQEKKRTRLREEMEKTESPKEETPQESTPEEAVPEEDIQEEATPEEAEQTPPPEETAQESAQEEEESQSILPGIFDGEELGEE